MEFLFYPILVVLFAISENLQTALVTSIVTLAGVVVSTIGVKRLESRYNQNTTSKQNDAAVRVKEFEDNAIQRGEQWNEIKNLRDLISKQDVAHDDLVRENAELAARVKIHDIQIEQHNIRLVTIGKEREILSLANQDLIKENRELKDESEKLRKENQALRREKNDREHLRQSINERDATIAALRKELLKLKGG